jgi:transcriptional regulator with XRE-family HTH domain
MSSPPKRYYFEMLPCHPQPEPLESLTSYLTRLAQANGMRSVHQLKQVCFPDRQAGVIQAMADYPWASFSALPTIAACPESTLLATTFYHLAYKFQRPTLPQTVGRFLSGTLAPSLRYCPLCLPTQQPYYSLAWRFRTLIGCPDHGCRLLDGCPHCSRDIPFLAAPFRLRFCPKCGQSLHTGAIEPLTDQEQQVARSHYLDLAFLLSPQPWEQEPQPRWVGPRLRRWRQIKQLTAQDVAHQTGKARRLVSALECHILERGANFQHFLDYVSCLGITMQELFSISLPTQAQRYEPPSPETTRQHENELIRRIQHAVQNLKSQDGPLTQRAVAEAVGMSVSCLRHYPRVKALLTQISQEYGQKRKQELVEKVEQAIKDCQSQHQAVTLKAVADRVGLSSGRLRFYPAVMAVVNQAKQEQAQRHQQELMSRVQEAIAQLKAQAQPVTELAVARLLGISATPLRYYPHIKALLDQSRQQADQRPTPTQNDKLSQSPQSSQQVLVERVQQAMASLQAQNRPLCRKAISRMIGRSTMRHYPDLAWAIEACLEDQQWRKQQREQDLIQRVEQAIKDLKALDQLPTQQAICDLTGLSLCVFRDYPRLKLIAAQLVLERHRYQQQQAQQRDQALLEALQAAIAALKAEGLLPTQRAVAQRVGVSISTLTAYPRTYARLQQMYQERVAEARKRAREREPDLVEKVQAAIEQLRASNDPVTQKRICRILGMARTHLKQYPKLRKIFEGFATERRLQQRKQAATRDNQG